MGLSQLSSFERQIRSIARVLIIVLCGLGVAQGSKQLIFSNSLNLRL